MPQTVWVTTAVALSAPASPTVEVEGDRLGAPDDRQVALGVQSCRRSGRCPPASSGT